MELWNGKHEIAKKHPAKLPQKGDYRLFIDFFNISISYFKDYFIYRRVTSFSSLVYFCKL